MADGTDEDHVIQHGNSGEGDEADSGRNRKRHVAEPQRDEPADPGERHAGKDADRIDDVSVGRVKQGEDQPEGDGHDNHQPEFGPFQLFELAAVCDVRPARRQGNVLVNPLFHVGNKAAQIPAANVARHRHPPLAPLAGNCGRPFDHAEVGYAGQRHPAARGRREFDRTDGLGAASPLVRKSNHEGKSIRPVHVFADRFGPEAFDEVEYGPNGHSCPREFTLLDFHLQHRLARYRLGREVGDAGNVLHHLLNLFGLGLEDIKVVSEHFYGQVGADAGDHFVNAEFDGLGEGNFLPGQGAEEFIHQLRQLRLRRGLRPFRPGLEADEHVREFEAHRVRGDLGHADAAPDVRGLVRKFGEDCFFDPRVHRHRFVDVRPRKSNDIEGNRTFREPRDEFAAERGGDQAEGDAEYEDGEHQYGDLVSHRQPQHRGVRRLDEPHQQRLPLRHPPGQHDRREGGHERERKHHRPGQCEDHRQCHRLEELTLDPFERQDRQVDDEDDEFAEKRRLANFHGRVADDFEPCLPLRLVSEVADAVFDHHHGRIDDEAEIDRPE